MRLRYKKSSYTGTYTYIYIRYISRATHKKRQYKSDSDCESWEDWKQRSKRQSWNRRKLKRNETKWIASKHTHTHNHEDSNKKSDSEENCLEFSCVKRQWEKGKNARKKYKWMLLCVSRCYHARSFSDIKFKIYDSKDVHRNEKKNREEWADCMHKTVQNRVQQQEEKNENKTRKKHKSKIWLSAVRCTHEKKIENWNGR